jgi:hypothetical protein
MIELNAKIRRLILDGRLSAKADDLNSPPHFSPLTAIFSPAIVFQMSKHCRRRKGTMEYDDRLAEP